MRNKKVFKKQHVFYNPEKNSLFIGCPVFSYRADEIQYARLGWWGKCVIVGTF